MVIKTISGRGRTSLNGRQGLYFTSMNVNFDEYHIIHVTSSLEHLGFEYTPQDIRKYAKKLNLMDDNENSIHRSDLGKLLKAMGLPIEAEDLDLARDNLFLTDFVNI